MSPRIEIQKHCTFCGNLFTAKTTVTQFCSGKCRKSANKRKIRSEKVERVSDFDRKNFGEEKYINQVLGKPIFTISDAALYLGVSRPTIYKYIEAGELKFVRLGSKFFINKKDIDVLFTSKKIVRPERKMKIINDFYTINEIKEKYKVKDGCIYSRIKKNKIPKVIKRGVGYYSKSHIDAAFKSNVDPSITEWYSVKELQDLYGYSLSAIYSFASENAIPKRNEGKKVFYSKYHFDVAKGFTQPKDEPYYTVPEAMEKYNLSRDAIYHHVKYHSIPKKKVGKYIKISAPELDAIFEPPQIT